MPVIQYEIMDFENSRKEKKPKKVEKSRINTTILVMNGILFEILRTIHASAKLSLENAANIGSMTNACSSIQHSLLNPLKPHYIIV